MSPLLEPSIRSAADVPMYFCVHLPVGAAPSESLETGAGVPAGAAWIGARLVGAEGGVAPPPPPPAGGVTGTAGGGVAPGGTTGTGRICTPSLKTVSQPLSTVEKLSF